MSNSSLINMAIKTESVLFIRIIVTLKILNERLITLSITFSYDTITSTL